MKHLYCANCGIELLFIRKAVKGNIYDLVQPHECGQINSPEFKPIIIEKPSQNELEKMFDSFEFSKKINKLKIPTGDNRSDDVIRKEKPEPIVSAAPQSIIEKVKGN